jgi:hypothetical protein
VMPTNGMRIVDPVANVQRATEQLDRYPSVGSRDSSVVWGARLQAREARNADWKLDPDHGPNGARLTSDHEEWVCFGCDVCNGPAMSRIKSVRREVEQRIKSAVNFCGELIWHERGKWAPFVRGRFGKPAAEKVYAAAKWMREYKRDPWA